MRAAPLLNMVGTVEASELFTTRLRSAAAETARHSALARRRAGARGRAATPGKPALAATRQDISRGTGERGVPRVVGDLVLGEVTVLFTTWKRAPQIAAKCKTNSVAALWNMARRHSEPLKVRPAIGVRLAPRSLRSGPALRSARVSARAPGSGSPFRPSPEHFQTRCAGENKKPSGALAREGPFWRTVDFA